MTDFEVAIRDSFLSTFTSIQPPSQILVKDQIQELETKLQLAQLELERTQVGSIWFSGCDEGCGMRAVE